MSKKHRYGIMEESTETEPIEQALEPVMSTETPPETPITESPPPAPAPALQPTGLEVVNFQDGNIRNTAKVLRKNNRGELVLLYKSKFNGKENFHIRTFYTDDGGELRPTKKGLSVPMDKVAAELADILAAFYSMQ